MKAATPRSTSSAESGATPLQAFLDAHPGAVQTIAIGTAIGAGLGLGVGLGLPGRGAWYRAAVTLLFVLGFALAGALVAAAFVLPRPNRAARHTKPDWQARVDEKMTKGSSSPTPRRVAGTGKGSKG